MEISNGMKINPKYRVQFFVAMRVYYIRTNTANRHGRSQTIFPGKNRHQACEKFSSFFKELSSQKYQYLCF